MRGDATPIACCFDGVSGRMLDEYRRKGLGSTSVTILEELESRGVKGCTILELGCGIGSLTVELVTHGASSGVGMDLSPNMVSAAKSLASYKGVGSSVDFRIGDGATEVLPESDMVVLDAVICCYPDVESLVANSSAAAKRFYAISIPDDRRPLTRFLGVFLPLQKLVFRRNGFRFFIHPVTQIIHQLEDSGFRVISDVPVGRLWGVLVFAAP